MKKIFTLLLLSSAWISNAQTNFNPADWGTSLTGFWTFENAADLGHATVGTDLTLVNGAQPLVQAAGPSGTDNAIYSSFAGNNLLTTTGIGANGGGLRSNQYTLMMDFMVPAIIGWNCLMSTEVPLSNDGELYLKGTQIGGGGTFGYYSNGTGAMVIDTWYRLVLTGDMTAAPGAQTILYRDGVQFMADDTFRSFVIDHAKASWGPQINILGDSDGEQGKISIGQIAIFNRVLDATEVSTLGAAVLGTPKFSAAKNSLKVYPNPVGSSAQISFNLASASKSANIELIDMTGRVVENIYQGSLEQGEQTISWTAKNSHSAGTYLVKLSSENTSQVYSILMK